MTSDRARVTFDQSRRYSGVIAQQGRVSLEADWNEAQAIGTEQVEARTLDLVGPLASPDEGYRIDANADTEDLRIHRGTVYVGGHRLSIGHDLRHGDRRDSDWVDWDYQRDHDWVDWANDPLWRGRDDDQPHDLVCLLAREQEVGSIEDRALRDVALGGPDTAQRLRIVQRVIRHPTSAATWEDAWGQLVQEEWIPRGFRSDRDTRSLEPVARLQVTGYHADTGEQPVDRGTYLGPNNQLIRVQIAGMDNGAPVLVWGYDNASFLYRLTSSAVTQNMPGQTTLTLATAPVDAYHQPAKDQAVEVLRSAAALGEDDYIAASTGMVVDVTTHDPDGQEVVVGAALRAEYLLSAGQKPPLFLRVWEGKFRCEPGEEYELRGTGLRVRLTHPEDVHAGGFPVGAYWMIAVRPGIGPGTPGLVYPQRIVDQPQPPDGPRQWLAPVAFVRWHPRQPRTEDCISRFDSLARQVRSDGSCTVRLCPEDVGGGWALQDEIDSHASRDHSATICLEPGDYVLPKPLRIGPQHGRLTVRAARPGVVLRSEPEASARFLLGLIVAREAEGLRLEGLDIRPARSSFVIAPDTHQHLPERARPVLAVHRHRTISIGLHAVRCTNLAVRDCRFDMSRDSDHDGHTPEQDLFAAGIFGAEELRGLRIERCRFSVREPINHARWRPDSGEAAEGAHDVALGFVQVPTAMAVPLHTPEDKEGHGEPRGSMSVPLLDDAVFHDNLFEHLTAPVVAIGQLGTLRADRNSVRACHAGFWLINQHASHVLTLLDRLVNQVDEAYRDLLRHHLTALAEPLLFHTTVLARTLPRDLPEDVDVVASPRPLQPPSTKETEQAGQLLHLLSTPDPEKAPPSAAQKESMPRRLLDTFGRIGSARRQPDEVAEPPGPRLRCSLDVTENTIDSGSAPALVILDTAEDSAVSLVLTGNQLRSWLRRGAVACLYLLRACAVSANIITNGDSDHDDAASLLVRPHRHRRQHQTAITGNVLVGEAHLPYRPNDLPAWAVLNSVTRS